MLSRSQDLENGTAFQLQFVNAHLLPNLSQNWKPIYSPSTMTKNVAQHALVQDLFLFDISAQLYCIVLYKFKNAIRIISILIVVYCCRGIGECERRTWVQRVQWEGSGAVGPHRQCRYLQSGSMCDFFLKPTLRVVSFDSRSLWELIALIAVHFESGSCWEWFTLRVVSFQSG